MTGPRIAVMSALLSGCWSPSSTTHSETVDVFLSSQDDQFAARIEGRSYDIPGDAERLRDHLAAVKARNGSLRLHYGRPDLPYRCVDGIIFESQSSAFRRVERAFERMGQKR